MTTENKNWYLPKLIEQAEIIYGKPAVVELNKNFKFQILEHLLSLDAEERKLRFYSSVTDDYIRNYVNAFNWSSDKFFGIFDLEQRLISFLHLSLFNDGIPTSYSTKLADIGISVDKQCRGKGYAKKLMARVLNHCISIGVNTLIMQCLKENKIMQNLAKSLNMQSYVEDDEIIAKIKLDVSTSLDKGIATYNEYLYKQVSLVDSSLKFIYVESQKHYWNLTGFIRGLESLNQV